MEPNRVLNREVLGRWIQPQHLSDDTLGRCRQNLATSGVRFLVLDNFLNERTASELAELFTNEAVYRTERRTYSSDREDRFVDETEWIHASEDDRFFTFDVFTSARPEYILSKNVMTFLKFIGDFPGPPFMDFFSRLLGVPIGGVQWNVHSMGRGDFLRIHNDDLRNRQFAFVLYLSPGWNETYGGTLHLVEGAKTIQIEPRYNSLVMFDVTLGIRHFVETIRPSAELRRRVSFGGWFLRPS
jgi:Rps23 Pro-64 3,4-dihydroxylase Tpa1-like proline 4-hydroxylase